MTVSNAGTRRSHTAFWGAAFSCMLLAASGPTRAAAISWDRVANVEMAARQIGEIQVRGGVEQAFKFISACYKTHSLASKYSKAFEGCIAQDFIVSRALVEIYSRVPPETLRKIGSPSPQQLDQSFKQRAGSAFAQYEVATSDAVALAGIIEKHGLPVFLKIVFPQPATQPDAKPSPQPEPKK